MSRPTNMPRPASPFRRTFLPAALLSLAAAAVAAQSTPTQVRDASSLHPPPGARVAIVEFVDLECPVCASTTPIVEAAAAKYKIPLIRHDFLIPAHAWSPIAATNARWFDLKSRVLGDQYRDAVFTAQPTLYNNPDLLRDFTQNFAAAHHIALPFAIDPQGKLLAEVKADNDIGVRLGIDHTPTVFIVTSGSRGRPFIEVQRPAQDLYAVIDQALADTGSPSPSSTPAASAAASPTTPANPSPAPASPAQPQATAPTQTAPPTTPLSPTGDQPPTDHPPAGFPLTYKWALAAVAAIILAIIAFVVLKKKRQAQ
jgi:protein-disulfide isomerase